MVAAPPNSKRAGIDFYICLRCVHAFASARNRGALTLTSLLLKQTPSFFEPPGQTDICIALFKADAAVWYHTPRELEHPALPPIFISDYMNESERRTICLSPTLPLAMQRTTAW